MRSVVWRCESDNEVHSGLREWWYQLIYTALHDRYASIRTSQGAHHRARHGLTHLAYGLHLLANLAGELVGLFDLIHLEGVAR
jgi:hypothetical protein